MASLTDTSAQNHADEWLRLVDRGESRASWEAAGAQFRAAVTPEAWADRLGAARGPLGPLTSRALAVEQRLDGLPGAPPGAYLVQQYHAVYDARQAVVETLTLARDSQESGGEWRVVGYFIR